MNSVIRVSLLVIALEAITCAWILAKQANRPIPTVPVDSAIDDPLFRRDLEELAARAATSRTGDDWRTLAEALLGQGFYAEAELNFRTALDLQPHDYASRFGLALCLDRTGRIAESIPAYSEAAAVADSTSRAASARRHCLYAIGRAYLKLEDPARAEETFRQLAGFGPADYQLAKLLVRAGRASEALPLIESTLQRRPDSLLFNYALLLAAQSLGRTAEADQAADRIERSQADISLNFNNEYIDPLNRRYGLNAESEAYNRLVKTGDLDAAARKLREVLADVDGLRLPQRINLLARLSEIELHRKRPDGIRSAVKELRDLGVDNADLLQLEGASDEMLGNEDAAIELWLRAANMSPNIPLHDKIADYYSRRGQAAERDFHHGQAALLVAKVLYWSNQFAKAKTAATRATELIPTNAQAWFYAGEIARQLGENESAHDAYSRCVQLDPNHGRAIARLRR